MTGGAKPPHPFLSPSQDYGWIKNVRSMFCVSTSVMTSAQRKPPAPKGRTCTWEKSEDERCRGRAGLNRQLYVTALL
jgi:hypothetical protein